MAPRLAAGIDQLKEHVPAAGDADSSRSRRPPGAAAGRGTDALPQAPSRLGFGQRADEFGEGGEIDAAAGLDRSTARAMAKWVLPQPGWPRKWTTSWRLMKSRPARGRTRLRSSDGWNEKSNSASVLIASSRPHLQGGLDPTALAQAELLVEQVVDRLEGGRLPRSSCRSRCSSTSRARGMRRPTKWRWMRSRVAGAAVIAPAPRGKPAGRPPRGRPATGASRRGAGGRPWRCRGSVAGRGALGGRRQLAMPLGDAAPAAALEHGVDSDEPGHPRGYGPRRR